MRILAKSLEAIGIACVMIGLIDGIHGSMWLELYLSIIGLAVFFAGRAVERSLKTKKEIPKEP